MRKGPLKGRSLNSKKDKNSNRGWEEVKSKKDRVKAKKEKNKIYKASRFGGIK
jgi:hypothetical protein